MKKGIKSSMVSVFETKETTTATTHSTGATYVIHGGHILHTIVW